MKEEMQSMANNDVWSLLNLLKIANPLYVNGCIRLKETLCEELSASKLDWLLRALLRENV